MDNGQTQRNIAPGVGEMPIEASPSIGAPANIDPRAIGVAANTNAESINGVPVNPEEVQRFDTPDFAPAPVPGEVNIPMPEATPLGQIVDTEPAPASNTQPTVLEGKFTPKKQGDSDISSATVKATSKVISDFNRDSDVNKLMESVSQARKEYQSGFRQDMEKAE